MSEKVLSERDAIMRERAAFRRGAAWRFDQSMEAGDSFHAIPPREYDDEAKRRFPLPMVTRPRVATDPGAGAGVEWRVSENGFIERRRRHFGEGWSKWSIYCRQEPDFAPLPDRVKMWSDLLANPTEEVEADG